MVGTSANEADISTAGQLPRSEEDVVFGDSGYRGIYKRDEAQGAEMICGDDAEQAGHAEPVPLPGRGGRVRGEDEGRHASEG